MTALAACSNRHNTARSRWWQSFNTRYNVYYNGAQAYIEGSLAKEQGNKDNFTDFIPLYTVGNKASRELGSGSYKTAVTKAEKAIHLHSIHVKPTWTKKRRKTAKDLEWLSRREYNPFMWKVWMLMGRSQFQQGAFDEAAATFSYMSRLYKTQPAIYGKARAWLAKCYIEQDWIYDAEDVIRNMQRDSIDWRARKEWDYALADYYTHVRDWEKSIVYLRKVIKHEGRSKQRAREYYLLGQIQAAAGHPEDAYRSFRKTIRLNPPYELAFNARISMTEVLPTMRTKTKIRRLRRMAHSDKNAEYLDQVYYALGNVYLAEHDTLHAIAAYENGNTKATRSGIEKGVLLLHLGDLYWQLEKFSDARRCYGAAIGMLDKERPDYEQLSNRSKILDELCPHTEAVHLQDSLQALAMMPEAERNAAIDRVIKALKKKEREERDKQAEAYAQEQQTQNGGNDMATSNTSHSTLNTSHSTLNTSAGTFYFYNPQAVAQGKQQFQQQWGARKNEDNWQRINKTVVSALSDNPDSSLPPDSLSNDSTLNDSTLNTSHSTLNTDSISNDPHTREYYLKQIPFTEEQLASSNDILSDALFNSGVIFKDKLENYPLADKALTRVLRQFPEFPKTDEILYHMYLLRNRQGMPAEGEEYKDSLRERFPDSQWTKLICDPYYKENAVNGTHLEDSLYADTYKAFRSDNHETIARNVSISEDRFPMGQHRAKFIFVSGLSMLNQGRTDSCIAAMNRVVKEYPQSEVSTIAGMIVKGVQAGRRLHGAKFDIGSFWDRRTEVLNDTKNAAQQTFSTDPVADYLFVMTYNPDSLEEENQLLYEIAKYNFTNFLVRNFDVVIEDIDGLHQLQVSGFRTYDEAYQYTRALYRQPKIARIAAQTRNIIISKPNLDLLGTTYSYNDYDTFYVHHFQPLESAPLNDSTLNTSHLTLPTPHSTLNEPSLTPDMYDPEYQSAPKEDPDDNPDANDNPDATPDDTSITIDISSPLSGEMPAGQRGASPTIDISSPLSGEMPAGQRGASPTPRQQINSDIINIIDEENKKNDTPTTIDIPDDKKPETQNPEPQKQEQQNDDEYFDFDGF